MSPPLVPIPCPIFSEGLVCSLRPGFSSLSPSLVPTDSTHLLETRLKEPEECERLGSECKPWAGLKTEE